MDKQIADTQTGEYYVTAIDGKRYAKLLGPFTNNHAGALAMVDAVRSKAQELDPRAVWWSFGTCRLPNDDSVPIRAGRLNKLFGLPASVPDDGRLALDTPERRDQESYFGEGQKPQQEDDNG